MNEQLAEQSEKRANLEAPSSNFAVVYSNGLPGMHEEEELSVGEEDIADCMDY